MGMENAGVIFAMLFGNRSVLDYEVNENFRMAGFTHVLSVSGMHVGLVIGLLVLLLNLLRVPKKYQFFIILVIIGFYIYICDFRFAVMRSSMMFMIMLFNRIFFRRIDMLSNICMAGLITMMIFPFSLWSWSFQLSYACMFGIALFYRPVSNFLKRSLIPTAPRWMYKTHMFFIKGITLYIVVHIATIPLVILHFGAFPIYGILSNALFLPLLIIAFKLSVVALVTFVGGSLFYVVDVLVSVVRVWSGAVANVSFAVINVDAWGYWFLAYWAGVILMSRFIFLKPIYRYPMVVILLTVYIVGFLV